MNFGGFKFELWKIHSFREAIPLIMMLLLGAALFTLIILFMRGRRTRAHALAKIEKRLARLSHGKGRFADVAADAGPEANPACDAVFAAGNVLVLIKVFWWGLFATGETEGKTWEILDNKKRETVKNPLTALLAKCKGAEGYLRERKMPVTVLPLIVFADNYGRPQLKLPLSAKAIIFGNLKKWYKLNVPKLNKTDNPDAILDAVKPVFTK